MPPREDGGGDAHKRPSALRLGLAATSPRTRFNIMGTIDYRKQDTLRSVDRYFAKTGILRGDVVSGTRAAPASRGDVGGFEPSLPGCNPPSSIPAPDGDLSLRFHAPGRRHPGERAGHRPGARLLRHHARAHRLARVLMRATRATTSSRWRPPDPDLMPTSYSRRATVRSGPRIRPASDHRRHPRISTAAIRTPPCREASRQLAPDRRPAIAPATTATVTDRLLFELKGAWPTGTTRPGRHVHKNRSEVHVDGGYINDTLIQQGVFERHHQPVRPADRRRPGGHRRRKPEGARSSPARTRSTSPTSASPASCSPAPARHGGGGLRRGIPARALRFRSNTDYHGRSCAPWGPTRTATPAARAT